MSSAKRCVRFGPIVFAFRFPFRYIYMSRDSVHCGTDDDASRSTSAACLRFFWEEARTSQHGEVRLKLLEQLERIVVTFAELQRLGGELEGLLEVSELIGEQRAVEERLE
jgi:hypothetical protein